MTNKPKKKRMLLRSKSDYIDHEYWPRMRALGIVNDKRILEKYGGINLKTLRSVPTSTDGKRIEVPDGSYIKRLTVLEDLED